MSSSSSHPIYTLRSTHDWQRIFQQFAQSGLSAPQFCKRHHIAYSTFHQQQQRLRTEASHTPVSVPTSNTAMPFIELNAAAFPNTALPWHITLTLGNGVELCLSQLSAADASSRSTQS